MVSLGSNGLLMSYEVVMQVVAPDGTVLSEEVSEGIAPPSVFSHSLHLAISENQAGLLARSRAVSGQHRLRVLLFPSGKRQQKDLLSSREIEFEIADDLDGDGFTDSMEEFAGTDPGSSESSPTGLGWIETTRLRLRQVVKSASRTDNTASRSVLTWRFEIERPSHLRGPDDLAGKTVKCRIFGRTFSDEMTGALRGALTKVFRIKGKKTRSEGQVVFVENKLTVILRIKGLDCLGPLALGPNESKKAQASSRGFPLEFAIGSHIWRGIAHVDLRMNRKSLSGKGAWPD